MVYTEDMIPSLLILPTNPDSFILTRSTSDDEDNDLEVGHVPYP